MTPKKRIEAAVGQLEVLRGELQQARAKIKSLEEQISEAQRALNEARIAADADLPRATVLTHNRWTRAPATRLEVVIVKRTDKSATVRQPGMESTTQYRPTKHSGTWRLYPAPKTRFHDTWTELVFETKEA